MKPVLARIIFLCLLAPTAAFSQTSEAALLARAKKIHDEVITLDTP